MPNLDNYPGAKTNTGIIQFLVNHVPYHERYHEYFGGSVQLYLALQPATQSILNDLNKEVFTELVRRYSNRQGTYIYNADAIALLQTMQYSSNNFIYLDPPYPEKARRSGKKYYQHEMLSDDDHVKLLMAARAVPANIMISSKPNELYNQVLHDWNTATFNTVDRIGPYQEIIYMNYDAPPLIASI